ncbi:MAG: hypothetical protein AB7V48_10515 [Sedimentibacter sp.]
MTTGMFFALTGVLLVVGVPIAITVGLSSIIYILAEGIKIQIVV